MPSRQAGARAASSSSPAAPVLVGPGESGAFRPEGHAWPWPANRRRPPGPPAGRARVSPREPKARRR
eukprot:1872891-Prymnesium_polylepis.1